MPGMTKPGNLFLVGLMGSGKTTLGKALAKHLHLPFRDSDHEIEQRTGAAISLIFELEGEAGFRAREKVVLAELVQLGPLVLATGGGAVLEPANRALLAQHGRSIYLHAPVEQLLRRTANSRHRPLLHTADPRARLEELLRVRDPLYREIADIVIETGGRGVNSVVEEILTRLGLESQPRRSGLH